MSREPKKKPGEFLAAKRRHKRIATIYDIIRGGIEQAKLTGSAVIQIDNRKFHLTPDESKAGDGYYTTREFVKLKRRGLAFVTRCTKDAGFLTMHFPVEKLIGGSNGIPTEIYVERVEVSSDGGQTWSDWDSYHVTPP
jgi:hypothetical protein